MLQEIAPHIFYNEYDRKREPAAGDKILCYGKNELYMRETSDTNSGYEFPLYEEIFKTDDTDGAKSLCYLFSIDNVGYFMMDKEDLHEEMSKSDMYKFQSMQVFRKMGDGDTIPIAMMTGLHLRTWMKKNRFCGSCGHRTENHKIERALQCPNCGNLIFPQISPVVAVAIINEDKILLARNAQGGTGRYSILAGYTEIGESMEQTVHREVMEEVGLAVKNLKYYKSQPWGLTGIEMMGYFVELDGSSKVTIQESELAEARWFTAEEINWEMPLHSLSYTMINEFKKAHIKE